MAHYAIGDIHGCYKALQALLPRLAIDPERDRLWLVGDLVNRGPRSLAVLRWAQAQGDHMICVLGNHDLHLLARWRGIRSSTGGDTLAPVLRAKDADDLCQWLRRRPLVRTEGTRLLVHAGMHPGWTVRETTDRVREAEAMLRGDGLDELLTALQDEAPPPTPPVARAVETIQVLTRYRTCRMDGSPCSFTGPPEEAPEGCHAWFEIPGARWRGPTIIFGHWAAMGFRRGDGWIGLDTGAAWGGKLTAIRLEDGELFQEEAEETRKGKKKVSKKAKASKKGKKKKKVR
jgi:bis(5'-nucleosyl)-tetraphosphatase (symmetrical)